MAKKKGNKLPKGTRQSKREKLLAKKQTPVIEPEAEEKVTEAAEQAETVPVAAPVVEETPAVETPEEPEKEKTAKKPAGAKKPAVKKASAESKAKDAAAPAEKKKPGRKPMTGEQKAQSRKEREELKVAADSAKTSIYIQYKGMEDGIEDLVAAVRADYKAAHKRTPINSIKLYVKPEEYTAYYVVNDSYFGKVGM